MRLQFDLNMLQEMGELAEGRTDEFNDILALLLDNASVHDGDTEMLARFMACASLKENHLWQDMGLPDRGALSALMEQYFFPLFRKNTRDMKWKKFFYKQVCEREGFYLCKSPSCGECVDYVKCFGPEE
jgi:nitrogen fixation protein NifQ